MCWYIDESCCPLAKSILAPLAPMTSAFAKDVAVQRKTHARGVVRVGKGIILVISKEQLDDIIRIMKLLENSDVLIAGVSETMKHKIKRQVSRFLVFLGALGALSLGSILIGKKSEIWKM